MRRLSKCFISLFPTTLVNVDTSLTEWQCKICTNERYPVPKVLWIPVYNSWVLVCLRVLCLQAYIATTSSRLLAARTPIWRYEFLSLYTTFTYIYPHKRSIISNKEVFDFLESAAEKYGSNPVRFLYPIFNVLSIRDRILASWIWDYSSNCVGKLCSTRDAHVGHGATLYATCNDWNLFRLGTGITRTLLWGDLPLIDILP